MCCIVDIYENALIHFQLKKWELQIAISETAPRLMNADVNTFPKKSSSPWYVQVNPSAAHVRFQEM